MHAVRHMCVVLLLACLWAAGAAPVRAEPGRNPAATPMQPDLQIRLDMADARHLLARTGFGASPRDVSELIGRTRAEAIDRLIGGLRARPIPASSSMA